MQGPDQPTAPDPFCYHFGSCFSWARNMENLHFFFLIVPCGALAAVHPCSPTRFILVCFYLFFLSGTCHQDLDVQADLDSTAASAVNLGSAATKEQKLTARLSSVIPNNPRPNHLYKFWYWSVGWFCEFIPCGGWEGLRNQFRVIRLHPALILAHIEFQCHDGPICVVI